MASLRRFLTAPPCSRMRSVLRRRASTAPEAVAPRPAPTATGRAVVISNAMKAYLQRAQEHDDVMQRRVAEYDIGKRHLANMMGVDPDHFAQADIDNAIAYLLPSGLHHPKARPTMKHPSEIYALKKAVEFERTGRPFHSFFYTTCPNYFQSLHDMAFKLEQLNKYADGLRNGSREADGNSSADLQGTEWLDKEQLEILFLEELRDEDYTYFVVCMNRLVSHAYSNRESDFIHKFRKKLLAVASGLQIPKLMLDENGRPFMTAIGKRKRTDAEVIVTGAGSGKFEINGTDIAYFDSYQSRQQVLFPLLFTRLLGLVDVKATTAGIGFTAEAGAVRQGVSLALRSFVSSDTVERMRQAGLLTRDPRCKERKKPGQEGARRKYTWKKR